MLALACSRVTRGLQARHGAEPGHAPLAEDLASPVGADGLLHGQGHVEVGRAAHLDAVEAGAGHPDDRHGPAVDRHGLADDLGVGAEAALPEAVRQDDEGMRVSGSVVVGAKDAPQHCRDAEHVEEIPRHEVRVGLLRGPLVAQVYRCPPVREHPLEGLGLVAEVHVHRVGDGGQVEALVVGRARVRTGGIQHHQAFGVLHGQDAQEHLVHQREDGRVGADAQGQGEDDHGGEPGVLGQGPQREPQVLLEVVHLQSPGDARPDVRVTDRACERRASSTHPARPSIEGALDVAVSRRLFAGEQASPARGRRALVPDPSGLSIPLPLCLCGDP